MVLVQPPDRSDRELVLEQCDLMIEESVEDVRAIQDGGQAARPSFRGVEYDEGYAQGRKDACRVIRITLDVQEVGPTSRTLGESP